MLVRCPGSCVTNQQPLPLQAERSLMFTLILLVTGKAVVPDFFLCLSTCSSRCRHNQG